jgi:hypothetical protein
MTSTISAFPPGCLFPWSVTVRSRSYRRVGGSARFAPDGTVEWTGPNSGRDYSEYGKIADALDQAAKAASRLRVAIIDGKPTSVIAPPERVRGK